MLRVSLAFLLLAPPGASALYWLEGNSTSASELMTLGNWAHSPLFSINYGGMPSSSSSSSSSSSTTDSTYSSSSS